MKKCESKNLLLKVLLTSFIAVTLLFVLPMTASAADFTENQPHNPSVYKDKYYIDTENNEYWVVDTQDGKWHECVGGLDNVINMTRNAMYQREDSFSTYFALPKSDNTIIDFFNIIKEEVYKDSSTPYGGEYLKWMSNLDQSLSYLITTQEGYDFYFISMNINNVTTKVEEKLINDYLTQWNKEFIEENQLIQSSHGKEREYYIVKTIYNFIAKNNRYDFEVYNGDYKYGSERYRISHTAYGALFGNTSGAYEPDNFDFNDYSPYQKSIDAQGLYTINGTNRGDSVCDGYSLLFYYMCKMNNIDCRIIQGDNVSGMKSDPHAWNMVYLKDSLDSQYEWYAVDVTFGSQLTKKISDRISIMDYTYFLRGSANSDFSAENHQQAYDRYDLSKQSEDDFRFEIKGIDQSKAYTIITRRRTKEIDKSDSEEAQYNFEDYIIISPQGDLFKLVHSDDGVGFEKTDGFTFYSSGYYYSCDLFAFSKDIEYVCDDKFLVDAGTYTFDISTVLSHVVYTKTFSISPLDMGHLTDYSDYIKYEKNVYFSGSEIEYKKYLHVYDSADTQLIDGEDYTAVCYEKNTPGVYINPKLPGNYIISISYKGNYCGTVNVPLTVHKTDLSYLGSNVTSEQYGINIEDKYKQLKIGDTVIYAGKDYTVSAVGGKNYGDTGKIILTALDSSEYLSGGTSTQWTYNIDKQYDISSLFSKATYLSKPHYDFTGMAVEPDDFVLSYVKTADNEKVVLVKDVDYKITGYANNINVGTGIVYVQFIGNYTGSASFKFYIDPVSMSVNVPDLVYNGKKQTPAPVVHLGKLVLKQGVDYTVTGSAVNPGAYQLTVKGIGNYSNLSGNYVYHIVPAQLTGVSASASNNSVKFSWQAQGSNCIYQVWALDKAKNQWRYIAQTTGTSLNVTWTYVNGVKKNLTANTNYSFRVRAYYQVIINGEKVEKFGDVKEIDVKTTGGKAQWLKSGKRWWYRHADGSYTKNDWEKIGGKWYHFDKSGWMQTGWLKDGGKWYYLNSSGVMTTGWQKISGKWYYMNSSGVMQTGWLKLGGKWYYMNSSGVMLTGRQKIGNKWYTFNSSGVWIK